MKYIIRAITAIILAEIAVQWLQANSDEYWPMFPAAVTFDSITYDTEWWFSSWSPVVYLGFVMIALLPSAVTFLLKGSRCEEIEIEDHLINN